MAIVNIKKVLTIVLTVSFAILLVQGCSAERKPTAPTSINVLLLEIDSAISNNSWSKASNKLEDIKLKWKKSKPVYQLNQRFSDIGEFETGLDRLKVFIDQKDKSQALAELKTVNSTWKTLNKL